YAAHAAPDDTTPQFDTGFVSSLAGNADLHDLYRYAVIFARRRNIGDLEEVISLANLVVGIVQRTPKKPLAEEVASLASEPTFWRPKEASAKAEALLTATPGDEKEIIKNFIDAWSKRKANRTPQGNDYEANQRLNGFQPPSGEHEREGGVLHYHEDE